MAGVGMPGFWTSWYQSSRPHGLRVIYFMIASIIDGKLSDDCLLLKLIVAVEG